MRTTRLVPLTAVATAALALAPASALARRQAQRHARGFVQIVGDLRTETRPKPRVGLRDQRCEKLLERTRIGRCRQRRGIAAGALQSRFDPDCVLDP